MADSYRQHFRQIEASRDRGLETNKDELPQRYIINEDLTVSQTWTHLVPDDVIQALTCLTSVRPLRYRASLPRHAPDLPADITYEQGYSGLVAPLGFEPPAPPVYDLERVGRAPGVVLWRDLVKIARGFDETDVAVGRQMPGQNSWFNRLHSADGVPSAVLMEPGPNGLVAADGIDLAGMKHLIGLPGAGKTTLLYLLAGYLSQRGYSVCFLFPSIEVASGFLDTLAQYNVPAGLLSGQSETARTKHVLNFATALASKNLGYGVTRAIAPFFATNCALAGFASDEDMEFPHASPPCMQLMQRPSPGKRPRRHHCALSSVCGLQYSERMLTSSTVWAGHILSTDRRVSALYSDAEVQHFEYLARTFDVLVIDECDGAQANLDARGTPTLKLSGDSNSLWSTLIRDLHDPAARGHNAFVAGVTIPTLLEMTGRFGRATERFVARLLHLPKKFRDYNANLLLTSLSIISDMFPPDDDWDKATRTTFIESRRALEAVFDSAMKVVAFRRTSPHGDQDDEDEETDDPERTLAEAAKLSGTTTDVFRSFYDQLLLSIEAWERDGDESAIVAISKVLRTAPGLSSSHDEETFYNYASLLVSVTLLVLQHFGLAPHLRLMNSMNLVSDNVFESRCSRDALSVLPESLIGKLSGIRYSVSEEGNVDIAHVGFAGTPRLLPNRMVEIGTERGNGMAVLMTSATSMLEQSPSYHVNIGPHYILRRPNAGSGWQKSKYHFLPKHDPRTQLPLRFSGAKLSQREQVMNTIADQLLRHGALSDVEQAIANNDIVNGVGRKAAFIVNSYEQSEQLFDHILAHHPSWRGRVRYLTRPKVHGTIHEAAVTASEVETLGDDENWDLLIFPMSAIGRGVNIVYRSGARRDKAMIGSLYFLTRPHPRGDSLQLIQGLVGRHSEAFDRREFATTADALKALQEARNNTTKTVEYLLRMELISQRLGKYAEPFVADQMIMILQTIGRAMRGDCPAFVYFVDAAWAPNSAKGMPDTKRTSMLVMMQSILAKCLSHDEPAVRESYQNLYQSFSVPMGTIENLINGPNNV
ncbi:ATP-binding protein [Paraburkholderia sp. RL18-101-BIB-B]|uniref:ATP-binding protein n=1 Tax=Paraburkholderia sp. RL18-101-BIB-B TaxID=3031634 RepID=UPI0038BBBD47